MLTRSALVALLRLIRLFAAETPLRDISLSGFTGNVQWQSSTDGTTWNDITGATGSALISAQMGALTATTRYRAMVISGVCSPAVSNMVTVNVDPVSVGGTASSDQTICSGDTPSDISLSGFTGNVQWQSSTDGTTWNDITGATGSALISAQMGALTATTRYRAMVISGVCSPAVSNMVTVNVDPVSVGGAASANQTICSGNNPSDITLSGFTGNIQWQSSPDGTTWNDITGATGSALISAQMGALTATTRYRAMVISGVCSPAVSNMVTVNVDPVSVGGAASSSAQNQTICSNMGNVDNCFVQTICSGLILPFLVLRETFSGNRRPMEQPGTI
jgi:hypothetical protein